MKPIIVRFSERENLVLSLRQGGKSLSEIARELGVDLEKGKSILAKARRKQIVAEHFRDKGFHVLELVFF